MTKVARLVGLLALATAHCGVSQTQPSSGGEEISCPDGTPNAGNTIRTVNCRTILDYDGSEVESSLDVPGLASAGIKQVDKALREVDAAATDSQIQFTQVCELYNGCNLTSGEYRTRLDAAQAHFRTIREKVALLNAAQGNPEVLRATVSELYAAAVPAPARAKSLLGLEFIVQSRRQGAGAAEVLRGGEHLRAGDQVVFGVRVSQPAHVYVFQRKSATGSIEVLFPNAQISNLKNPLPAVDLVRIPPGGGVFTLDDQDLGKEDVFIAASLAPLGNLEAALDGGHGKRPEEVGHAVTDLFVEGAPECREKTRGLVVTNDSCGSPTRGLTPTPSTDDAGFFQESQAMRAQTLPGDDVILQTFSFHHDR